MIDFSKLSLAFEEEEIEWRIQSAGETKGRIWARVVPYVTNRAVQQRLDDVCGPENWSNEFTKGPDGGVLCGLSIRVPVITTNLTTGEVVESQEFVTKWDGAENTDVEGVRGGLSSAMKRAAVQWGIGRFLYALEEMFANVHEKGRHRGKLSEKYGNKVYRWDPPALPEWALPAQRLTMKREDGR